MTASVDTTAPPTASVDAQVRIDCYLNGSAPESIAADVREGLTRELKELSPKYLYDARGSELFDRITTLPEYYPTRCEREILNRHAPEIMAGAEELVELGSGTASKTRALLYAMAAAGTLRRYVPFDVSEDVVEQCATELIELFPGLRVHGIVGDFERDLERLPDGERRVFAFLGGTIGNLHRPERARFLERVRDLMDADDKLLIGTDLVKDAAVIEAAYNDSQGVTAEFNRNVLRVVNAGLEADFDPEAFAHRAYFDAESSWIEMRLRANGPQVVRIPGADLSVSFADGEEMRTEISTKFTPDGIEDELAAAGLAAERFMTDSDGLFGLTLACRG
jgi:L-histidine Nalpha-methyltransferase